MLYNILLHFKVFSAINCDRVIKLIATITLGLYIQINNTMGEMYVRSSEMAYADAYLEGGNGTTPRYLYTTRTYLTTTKSLPTVKAFNMNEYLTWLSNIYEQYRKTENDKHYQNKTASPQLNIGHFDIQAGRIASVHIHPDSDAMYVCEVDVGIGIPVVSVLALRKQLSWIDVFMKWVLVLRNIKPRLVMGVKSEVNIFYAVRNEKFILISPPHAAIPGDVVTVRGFPRQPKEFVDEDPRYARILSKCVTNFDTIVCYRGIPWEIKEKGLVYAFNITKALIIN